MKNATTNHTTDRSVSEKRRTRRYRFLLILILSTLAKLTWGQAFHANADMAIIVGDGATAMATADFNGDGLADIAAVFENQNMMDIVLAKPGGGQMPGQKFQVMSSPRSIAVGDFNGDKKPDIIVGCVASKDVKVFLNDTQGHFSKNIFLSTPVGPSATALAVADFNGDKKLDVAVTQEASSSIRVMLGTGLCDFLPPNYYNVGTLPRSIAVADLNSDGKPDLAVANNQSGTVSVLINKGILGFYPATHTGLGVKLTEIVAADFTGDGKPELAVVGANSDRVYILFSSQSGAISSLINYTVGYGATSLAAGDLNGDGKTDLVAGNLSSGNAAVMMNMGWPILGTPTYHVSQNPLVRDVLICDVNADGKSDFVVTSASNGLKVFFQQTVPVAVNNTPAYQVTKVPDMVASLGQAFSYTVPNGYFSDAESPNNLTYSFSDLPAGISFVSPKTISGTPKGSSGAFQCKIKVADPQGQGVEKTFSFAILPAAAKSKTPTGIIPTRPNSRVAAEESDREIAFREIAFREIAFDATTYPNPVEDHFSVDIAGAANQKVKMTLMDINGRALDERIITPTDNMYQETVEMGQKQTGMYLLQVSTSTRTKTIKILKR